MPLLIKKREYSFNYMVRGFLMKLSWVMVLRGTYRHYSVSKYLNSSFVTGLLCAIYCLCILFGRYPTNTFELCTLLLMCI